MTDMTDPSPEFAVSDVDESGVAPAEEVEVVETPPGAPTVVGGTGTAETGYVLPSGSMDMSAPMPDDTIAHDAIMRTGKAPWETAEAEPTTPED